MFPVAHANLGALLTTASKGRPQHPCTFTLCAPLNAVSLWCRFLCNEFYELIRVMWSGKWVRSTTCVQSFTFLSLHVSHIVIHRVWCLLLSTSSLLFHVSCHLLSHLLPSFHHVHCLLCAPGCGDPRQSAEYAVAEGAFLPRL